MDKILTTLKENNVKATFFITAHYLNSATEEVEKMVNDGHIIGNHTVNHKSMPSINNETIEKEIMQLHQSMYEKFGYEITEEMFYHLIGTNEKTSKAYYHSVFGEDYPYQKIKDYRDQLRKEYFNSRRVAKKRINTIRKEDLIQVMKGASKWIK
jgi:peptidoglycan/xylan/chitin deacetylase (PgdA/CDA1 family)